MHLVRTLVLIPALLAWAGPALARRCRELLDERANVCRLWRMQAADIAPQGWQERSRRLYALAAEVTGARP